MGSARARMGKYTTSSVSTAPSSVGPILDGVRERDADAPQARIGGRVQPERVQHPQRQQLPDV